MSNQSIYQRAVKVIPGGVSRNTIFRYPHPFYVNKAKGSFITDIEGVKRIDFANNMASLIHGHANDKINNAVNEQLKKGTAYTMGSEIEVKYAELLNTRNPSFEKIRFVNSGTEAVMTMIKASRAYNGKFKIAKAEGTYHGTYDYAEISQTSNPTNWGNLDNPKSVPVVEGTPESVLNDVVIFPFNDLSRTIKILDQNADDISCVLIDLVPHRAGLFPAYDKYISEIYKWTRKNNALLLFDEVVTFRAYFSGAQEKYSVSPDLTALGKIIGGGFPIGAIAGKSEIMDVLNPRNKVLKHPHSGTFSANPISTIAGYTAMSMFDKSSVKKINSLADIAKKQIKEAINVADIPACVTGLGSMFRIHLQNSPPTNARETYQDNNTKEIINDLLDYLFLNENIIMINTCTCMLSTSLTQKEIDRLSQALLNGFRIIKPKINKLIN
ncbi:MAG: aspartate aminotransferase family protein [Flavobacteriales bacterium]|nr:aspartate aminotransferase family protein [Flavobacteriales bacterium]